MKMANHFLINVNEIKPDRALKKHQFPYYIIRIGLMDWSENSIIKFGWTYSGISVGWEEPNVDEACIIHIYSFISVMNISSFDDLVAVEKMFLAVMFVAVCDYVPQGISGEWSLKEKQKKIKIVFQSKCQI